MFFSLFGSSLGLLIFVIVREAVFGEDNVLEFYGATYSEV